MAEGSMLFQVDGRRQIPRSLKNVAIGIKQLRKFPRDVQAFNVSRLGLRGNVQRSAAGPFPATGDSAA